MNKKFKHLREFRVDRKNNDSYGISLNIKECITDFTNQEQYIELINEFSKVLKVPTEVIQKKSNQIISGYFDYRVGKFKKIFNSFFILKDLLIYFGILNWGILFSKKINLVKTTDIIIDDISDHLSYNRHIKLMSLFRSCLVFTNGIIGRLKFNSAATTISIKKLFLFNKDCLNNNKFKQYKFLIKLIYFSFKFNFNFFLIFKIVLYTSCKYKTFFSMYKAKYLLHDRFYRTCPIRNYYFKDNGGLISACTQKNICCSTISLFMNIDTLFTLGDEKHTKKRLLELGGDVSETIPVGSLFMEHDWFTAGEDLIDVPSVDIIILGLNHNTWLDINDANNINYLKTTLDWIKQISLEFPKYKILIKHHANLKNNKYEETYFKEANVETLIKTKSMNASYGYLQKSKIAFSFASTMVLEGISLDNQCFYMDPNLNGTCFFKGLDHISEIRIKSYDEFKEQIVNVIEKGIKKQLNKSFFCLKSDKTSNRIYEHLSNKSKW